MKVILLDVVHDLRSKRLWPVALALAVAIVLVPIVILVVAAPDEPGSSSVTQIAAVPQGAAAKIDVSTRSPGEGTDLDAFEPHNPFRPKGGPAREGSGEEAPADDPGAGDAAPAGSGGAAMPSPSDAASESSDDDSGSGGGGSDSGSSGSGSSRSGAKADDAGTGASDSANPDAADAGSKGQPATQRSPRQDAQLALLSYDVRAAYGRAGDVRSRVLEPLQVFPSNRRMFMLSGVDSRRKEAIFSVLDSSLSAQSGQGRCLHVGGRCTVLRLRDGQSRRFRDESGETWVLRLGRLELVRDLVDVDKADDDLRELIETLGG
jgi:hypothetical protein